MPRSLLLLALTAAIFVLQAIPYTGIFLMVVAAPLWSVVLVNLCFLGIVWEAGIRRSVRRAWLILPVLWFGLYYAAYLWDQRAIVVLEAEIEAANRAATASFDPRRDALVVTRAGGGTRLSASSLVSAWNLPVVYDQGPRAEDDHVAVRLAPRAVCDRVRAANLQGVGIIAQPLPRARMTEAEACLLRLPEAPTRPLVELHPRERRDRRDGLPASLLTTEIRTPDGRVATVVSGHASTLAPVPMPILGYALNSGAPSWNRITEWGRRVVPVPAMSSTIPHEALLAAALGIRTAERTPPDAAEVEAALDAAERRLMERDLGHLAALIGDPARRLPADPFRMLLLRPDEVALRVPDILGALERAAAQRSGAEANGRQLAELLAAAPTEALLPQADRILALYTTYGRRSWIGGTGALLTRTASFGVAAVPVLVAQLGEDRRPVAAALRGLCRVGAPAAASPAVPPALEHFWRSAAGQRRGDLLLYVTLLRLGLREMAEAAPREGPAFTAAAQTITSASPPDVCEERHLRSLR